MEVDGDTKTVRKRPDRKQKILDRKNNSETVVKSALLKYLNVDNKTETQSIIQDRVICYSKRMNMASIVLSGIIKELFNGVEDVLSIDIPNIFDQTFVRQLMLGTVGCDLPYQVITKYYNDHPECIVVKERYQADSNIYSFGAKTYITNLKNYFKLNFAPRMKSFTKKFSELEGLTDKDGVVLYYQINGWELQDDFEYDLPPSKVIIDTVIEHRRILDLQVGESISEEWFENKSNLKNMLRYFVLINRFRENNNLPLFNIVPICKIKNHFITIDTHSLYGIMKDLNLIGECNRITFLSIGKHHWNSFLKIERLQGRDNKFTGTIETDGISISTHFTRPKNEADIFKELDIKEKKNKSKKKNPIITLKKEDRIIGIDPGRCNIFFGTEEIEDFKFKSYKFTRKQYYSESGIFSARKQTNNWTKNIQSNLNEMSSVSSKGMNLDNHNIYLSAYIKNYDALWNEYIKSKWARQRLRLYGGKKRSFAKFFNKIRNFDTTKRVVIAFGSAKFAPGGKNEISIPTTRAFKECAMRFPTLAVDEFRTTKIFHEDDSVLESVANYKTNERLRGLLWCSSTNSNKLVNRDLNAAINIRRCIANPVRPISLTRIKGQPRLGNAIGKKLKF
jgi:ribosomal protein L35AE/L33A